MTILNAKIKVPTDFSVDIKDTNKNKDDTNENNEETEDNKQIDNNKKATMTSAETFAYLGSISKIITSTYKGDPNGLNAFISALELANASTAENQRANLIKFIKTKLEGKALEALPTNIQTVEEIIDALKRKIKPETSKVVLGRFLALRTERNAMTKFQMQAEELADQLRRAYISEGMNNELAEKTTIDKTVEMCRLSAKTNLVKSILASTTFNDPKEVMAKLITESNVENNEAQILYYRGNNNQRGKYNNFRGNTNGQFRGNWRGRNNGQYNNNGNRGRNFKTNYRGRGRGNQNNHNNHNNNGYSQNRNRDGQNSSRYVRMIEEENERAPSTQRGQNDTVSMQERRT